MANIKKYWLPITLGVIGVGYLLKTILSKPPKSVMDGSGGVDTKKEGSTTGQTDTTQSNFPLSKGSSNKALVVLLQTALGGKKTLPKYGIDGVFGAETEAAVIKYLGKPVVQSKAEMDKIAAANGLVYNNGSYIPKSISASSTPNPYGLLLTDISKPI